MKYSPEDLEYALRIIYYRRTMSEQEVVEWMENPVHLELLEELAALRRCEGNITVEEFRQAKNRLLRTLNRGRRLWMIGTIAASVLLALGAWQILVSPDRVAPADFASATIIPGHAKAHLILSGGEIIDLHEAVKEIPNIANGKILNDSSDGLKYCEISGGTGEYNVLQIPAGGFYKLELSDGTKVWLNAQSELRYPVAFDSSQREVWLKGEGYFEVVRDEKRQFRVHLEQADVTVLGTTFNISAYPDEKEIATTLVDGSISFRSKRSEQAVVLTPGKQSIMDGVTGETSVAEVDTDIYTSWREGRFVFRFMNLGTIMRQLQRWYDFEIYWQNPEIKAYEFRGVVQRDSRIEDVFKAIELATDVKFKINGKKVTIERK